MDVSYSVKELGLTVCYIALLICTCLIGDKLLSPDVVHSNFMRAILDNVTHGFVGFLAWSIVTGMKTRADFMLCCSAYMLASVIDVDHFLAAKSLRLQDALSLPSRPFLHASTIILPVTMLLWTVGEITHDNEFHILSLLLFTSWTTHHVRDANRRGLWFPPFGETPPLKKYVYLSIEILTPLVIKVIYSYFTIKVRNRNIFLNKNVNAVFMA